MSKQFTPLDPRGARPSTLPVLVRLRCTIDGGTFTSLTLGDPCPCHSAPSISADAKFEEPNKTTWVPGAFSDDAILKRLLKREAALPQEIRALEPTLAELRERRKAVSREVAGLRVQVEVRGTKFQGDLDTAVDALDEVDRAIDRVEDELTAKRAARGAVQEGITTRLSELRRTIEPALLAEAKKFKDAMATHISAIERLVADAENTGKHYEAVFVRDHLVGGLPLFWSEPAGLAVCALRHFSKPRGRKPTTILQMFQGWRRHADRI